MAIILLRNPQIVQPQQAAPIDTENPLSQALAFAWTNGPRNSVTGEARASSTSRGTDVVGKPGRGRKYVRTSTQGDLWVATTTRPAGKKTYAALYELTAAAAICCVFGVTIPTGVGWQIRPNTTNHRIFTASGVVQASITGPAITLNKPIMLIGVVDGTNLSLYVDGVFVSSTAMGLQDVVTTSLGIGYDSGGSNPADAIVYGAWVWNRPLSAAEVLNFSAQPWQVWKTPHLQFFPEPIAFLSATAATTLDSVTTASTAVHDNLATAGATLANVTTSATATGLIGLSGALTLANVTSAATATNASAAVASTTLAPVAGAATATVAITATAATTLGPVTTAGASTGAGAAVSATTLAPVVGSATAVAAIAATAAIALDPVSVVAEATGIPPEAFLTGQTFLEGVTQLFEAELGPVPPTPAFSQGGGSGPGGKKSGLAQEGKRSKTGARHLKIGRRSMEGSGSEVLFRDEVPPVEVDLDTGEIEELALDTPKKPRASKVAKGQSPEAVKPDGMGVPTLATVSSGEDTGELKLMPSEVTEEEWLMIIAELID